MKFVWEHNGPDTLLYSLEHVGAYTRGPNLEAAMNKIPQEMASYFAWNPQEKTEPSEIQIVQECSSDLRIADADSDVLFDSEKAPLTWQEYTRLKELALRSARDFHSLYLSVPDKEKSRLPARKTFYGDVPRTAQQMYDHTRSVNAYYFAEIGVAADNEGTIFQCRQRGFALLEQQPNFLSNERMEGSYGEFWTLRKVLRRFLWHDRIHAKAMFRMAAKTFGPHVAEDPFHFSE